MGGCHQCPLASLYLLIILFLRHGGWSVVRSQVLTSRGLSLPGPWFQIGETLFKSRAETIQLILVYQLLWEAKWMVLSFNIHFSCCSQQTLHFWVQRSSPFPFLFHTTFFLRVNWKWKNHSLNFHSGTWHAWNFKAKGCGIFKRTYLISVSVIGWSLRETWVEVTLPYTFERKKYIFLVLFKVQVAVRNKASRQVKLMYFK